MPMFVARSCEGVAACCMQRGERTALEAEAVRARLHKCQSHNAFMTTRGLDLSSRVVVTA